MDKRWFGGLLLGALLAGGPIVAPARGADPVISEDFVLMMAARNAAKAGKTETAISRYHRLLEKYPQHVEARYELGWLLLKNGQTEPARKELAQVLKHDPQHLGSLKGLLEIERKAGNKKEMLLLLEQLVALQPKDRELRMQLALELHNQERYDEAEKHIAVLLNEERRKHDGE
jgi:thioredoxin-like negative regulator of GroEL